MPSLLWLVALTDTCFHKEHYDNADTSKVGTQHWGYVCITIIISVDAKPGHFMMAGNFFCRLPNIIFRNTCDSASTATNAWIQINVHMPWSTFAPETSCVGYRVCLFKCSNFFFCSCNSWAKSFNSARLDLLMTDLSTNEPWNPLFS